MEDNHKKLLLNELLYGQSAYHINDNGDIKVLSQKEIMDIQDKQFFTENIEYLTKEEVLDKYGHLLSEDDLEKINKK